MSPGEGNGVTKACGFCHRRNNPDKKQIEYVFWKKALNCAVLRVDGFYMTPYIVSPHLELVMVIASSLLTKEIKKHYWHRIITPQHNRPMSIYSGFATRQLEEQYDTYTQSLISNIQKRLLKFYRGEASDDSLFFGVIRKLYHAMRKMEKYKYLEPKLSENFRELLEFSNPERLMTKDPTEAMNRITEERSERDLTMQSPPLFMHIP